MSLTPDMARCYRLWRPPFPQALLDDIVACANVARSSALLDLACGPGRVALALAPRFASVTAVDLEPAMIAEGKIAAAGRGLTNVTWHIARAEDFDAPPGAFQFITIGDAFHRFDQGSLLQKARSWLAPGGAVAILRSLDTLSGAEPWHHAVRDVIAKYSDKDPAKLAAPTLPPEEVERALAGHGFREVASSSVAAPYEWSLEAILGNLASTSYCAGHVLGANADAFAEDVRRALTPHAQNGVLREHAMAFGCTLGKA